MGQMHTNAHTVSEMRTAAMTGRCHYQCRRPRLLSTVSIEQREQIQDGTNVLIEQASGDAYRHLSLLSIELCVAFQVHGADENGHQYEEKQRCTGYAHLGLLGGLKREAMREGSHCVNGSLSLVCAPLFYSSGKGGGGHTRVYMLRVRKARDCSHRSMSLHIQKTVFIKYLAVFQKGTGLGPDSGLVAAEGLQRAQSVG